MTVKIGVSRMHWPVTVLGPGQRLGIWVQGCSIGCRGCMSRDTWPEAPPEDKVTVPEVIDQIWERMQSRPLVPDGVTISGGEPFEQPEALEQLIPALRALSAQFGNPDADILVYTGYEEERAREISPEAFSRADAVIVGPYRASEDSGEAWWGSANQRLVINNGRFADRYSRALASAERELQISVEGSEVFIAGIPPDRRTLAAIESQLAKSGIRMGAPSWRP